VVEINHIRGYVGSRYITADIYGERNEERG